VFEKEAAMALIRLNDKGRLCLTGTAQDQKAEISLIKDVLLLIDTSGSMAGEKIVQAKNGAIDFSRSASQGGYATALAVFGDHATMVCDPTVQTAVFESKVREVRVGIVGNSTNLAAGLNLAGGCESLVAVVVVTDGQPNSQEHALQSAAVLKQKGVEILCIGTDDADKAFLDKLATRKDLAMHVTAQSVGITIRNAAQLLLGRGR
jgi:Mg-chelatase subunit ChlD